MIKMISLMLLPAIHGLIAASSKTSPSPNLGYLCNQRKDAKGTFCAVSGFADTCNIAETWRKCGIEGEIHIPSLLYDKGTQGYGRKRIGRTIVVKHPFSVTLQTCLVFAPQSEKPLFPPEDQEVTFDKFRGYTCRNLSEAVAHHKPYETDHENATFNFFYVSMTKKQFGCFFIQSLGKKIKLFDTKYTVLHRSDSRSACGSSFLLLGVEKHHNATDLEPLGGEKATPAPTKKAPTPNEDTHTTMLNKLALGNPQRIFTWNSHKQSDGTLTEHKYDGAVKKIVGKAVIRKNETRHGTLTIWSDRNEA